MQSVNILFDAAANDRKHGAMEIERRLIEGLLASRQRWTEDGLACGAALVLSRQSAMANLRNLAHRLVGNDPGAIERFLVARLKLLSGVDNRMARAAWPLLEGSRRVLTISRSSTVEAILLKVWDRGWRGDVVVFDGSPAGCGLEHARRLAEIIPGVQTMPDAVIPSWLDDARATVVLVGADAVSPARLVNACGTRVLVELAAARSVSVVVAADSGKDLPDEEIDEVLAAGPLATEEGTDRTWPIFEAVPMSLVTERIAE